MDFVANPLLLAAGLAFLLFGLWCWRRGGRLSLVDAATDAAWDSVKSRDIGKLREHVEGRISEIAGDGSVSSGAKKIAGLAAREAFARVLRMAGMFSILAGLVLGALGLFWR